MHALTLHHWLSAAHLFAHRFSRSSLRLTLLVLFSTLFHSTIVAQPVAPTPVPLKLKLPFPAGSTYEVIQGHGGEFTHTGYNEYAIDFGLPENSPVCAAAAGRVVRVKQDGTTGGPSSEFFSQGNTIIIDHGQGLFTQYLHLAHDSALVGEGEMVRGGQIIARSGHTGFSNMPHLHFQAQNAIGQSLPIRFLDVPGRGVPATGQRVTSENDGTSLTQYGGESRLPAEVFARNSISLITRTLPAHLYRRGREYHIRGRLTHSSSRRVVAYFMAVDGGAPLLACYANTDKDGFFQLAFDPANIKYDTWSQSPFQSNLFSLAIAPVNPDGTFWSDISVPVCVR